MIQEKIEALIKPTIEALGYELWACEYLAQGRHSLLRIYIDKPDGIGIDDCERVSHQVNGLLDVEEPISGHYSLEVSSPGIPRPLFTSAHYQRYCGHEVQVRLQKPVQGRRKFTGTIAGVEEDQLVLVVENERYSLPFFLILKANLINE